MKILFLLVLASLIPSYNAAATVENLLPGLAKTGTGTVNYLGLFKVYDAELYTPPVLHSSAVLSEATSRCLVLRYDLDLSAEDIIKGANAVLKRQNSQEMLDKISVYIDAVHNSYTNVQSGDSYTLCYDAPSSTTKLLFNNEEVVSINSTLFAKIYFGIWLDSREPISETLRDNLLAQLTVNN